MFAEHETALTLQSRLLALCEVLAGVIAVPASRRDGVAILGIWAEIDRLRNRASSTHRRLRSQVRRIKADGARADHASQRMLDTDAKLFGKRLRMWDSMDTLVQRHVSPEPVDLILRPIQNDTGSLLSMIHRAFHRLANPNDQTREADEAGCFADIPMQVQKFDLMLSAAYRVANELRDEASRTGGEILRRSSHFDFDTGFWTPVLDAASFNGSHAV